MLEMKEQEQFSQSKIYDDLSQIISLFRRILQVSNAFLHNISAQKNAKLQDETLTSLSNDCLIYIDDYDYVISDESPNRHVYYRFVCRLLQTVNPFRTKQHYDKNIASLYNTFTNNVQLACMGFKVHRNIAKILSKMRLLVNHFLHNCRQIVDKGKDSISQSWNLQQQQPQKQLKIQRKRLFTPSQTNFNKIISEVNKRYIALGNIGLDYNAFKSAFFRSKNNKEQFYQDCFQRNSFILKQIYVYSQIFSDYLKRKEQKSVFSRRNRFTEEIKAKKMSFQNDSTKRGFQKSKNLNFVDSQSKGRKIFTREEHSNFQCPPFTRLDQEQSLLQANPQNIRRKTNYHMKTIFLTLNKPKLNIKNIPFVNMTEKQSKIRPGILFQKQFETPVCQKKSRMILLQTRSIFQKCKEQKKIFNSTKDGKQKKLNIRINYLNHKNLQKRQSSFDQHY